MSCAAYEAAGRRLPKWDLPISGPGGLLAALGGVRCKRKIFFHINNTNPILDESSQAYADVLDAGWEVARDGMEIQV